MARPGFSKFKKVHPKTVQVAQEDLVKIYPLHPERPMPLVVERVSPDLDAAAWLSDKRPFLTEKLYKHGALLLRNFDITTAAQFEAFAASIVPDLYGEYGDLPPEEGKVYGATPYPADKAILFHNESSHMHRWPMKQFFCCVVPSSEGGETPIADCRELYQAFEPALIETLANKGLRYIRNFHKGYDVSWQDFFKTEDRDEVAAYCQKNGIVYAWKSEDHLYIHQDSPAVLHHPVTGEALFFNQIQLHHVSCLPPEAREAVEGMFQPEDLPRNVTYGDGTPLGDDTVAMMLETHHRLAVTFRWQAGDVLMVDNMLTTHSRNPYTPPRKIMVAMGDIKTLAEVRAS